MTKCLDESRLVSALGRRRASEMGDAALLSKTFSSALRAVCVFRV